MEFTSAVLSIFRKHLHLDQISYASKISSGGKYLSLTITFIAQSKEQLNEIYEDLNGHELVVMTV